MQQWTTVRIKKDELELLQELKMILKVKTYGSAIAKALELIKTNFESEEFIERIADRVLQRLGAKLSKVE